MNPLSLVTWLIDHLLHGRADRPRLHLSASSREGGPWFGFADRYTGRVSTYGGGPEVVIRAVAVGGTAVEVEKIGMKLDDGAVRWFDGGGVLPAVLKPPAHIDLGADRASLKGEIRNRRVERFVAVGTDGHQFEDKVPREWRVPDSWPD